MERATCGNHSRESCNSVCYFSCLNNNNRPSLARKGSGRYILASFCFLEFWLNSGKIAETKEQHGNNESERLPTKRHGDKLNEKRRNSVR